MTSSGEITVEVMQQMLREVEKDNTIAVLPCLAVDELTEGLHGGSHLSRVTVKYTRHGSTSQHSLSLIVKVVPKNSSLLSSTGQALFFIREIQMFDVILPRMSTLLSQAIPDRYTDFTARVYYTQKIPNYIVAAEDLAPRGFKAPKRKNGLDLEHSLHAFRTLARFHAASVMIRLEDESLLAVFDTHLLLDDHMHDDMKKMVDDFGAVISQAIESRPEFGASLAGRLRHRYQTVHEDLKRTIMRNDNGFNVLNHGDFGLHNVMYRHSESSGEVEAIMLVDFQCCTYNSPVLDLHQFIFGSASDDVRENHIDTLLREYHTELTATLESLGAPLEQTISLTQLHDEFDRKMLYGFFCITCLLPFLSIDLSSGSDLTSEDVFGAGGGIEKLQPLIADSFFKSLSKVLPIFEQKQLI